MIFRCRFRDIAVLPLTAAGVSLLLLSATAQAQSESAVPTNLNGASLKSFGQKGSKSAAAPTVAVDPSQQVVLPPIPPELRTRDTRPWWQRRKAATAEAARKKGVAMAEAEAAARAEAAAAAAPGPPSANQPQPARSRAGSAAATAADTASRGDGRASAEVALAAPGPPTGPFPAPSPEPVVASYEGGSEVPVNNAGQVLRAYGSKQEPPAVEASGADVPLPSAIPGVEASPSPGLLKRIFLPWHWFK